MSDPITRRAFVMTAGVASMMAGTAALPRVGGAPPARIPDLSLPENNLRAVVRMSASLREEDVPWWYDGTIYAVLPGENPRPILKFEGLEIYWMIHLEAGAYEMIGNTLTFFRDFASGAMIDKFANPFTGAGNDVPVAMQGGGPGRGFNYSTNGIRFTKVMTQIPDMPLRLDWTFARDMVWLHNQTNYPPGLPPPRSQRQSMFATQKDFANKRLDNLPATFSSTVHMPWFKWLDMGDRPGHMVWHASGVKLRSVDQLPPEYAARARRDYPQLLTADPARAAERIVPSVK